MVKCDRCERDFKEEEIRDLGFVSIFRHICTECWEYTLVMAEGEFVLKKDEM